MNKPHKHAKYIKAWADGAEIQRQKITREVNHVGPHTRRQWIDDPKPIWSPDTVYRIKPREFEEGAWYPVVFKDGLYRVCVYQDGLFASSIGSQGNLPEHFPWIGEKLEIEWPEGSE